jgi:hypothetical protein
VDLTLEINDEDIDPGNMRKVYWQEKPNENGYGSHISDSQGDLTKNETKKVCGQSG